MTKTINNQKIKYETKILNIDDLLYYPDNPRIMSEIEKLKEKDPNVEIDQTMIDKLMWDRDATHTLYMTIKKDGGLNEALLVYENYVLEGNTRLCCLKRLAKNENDDKWKQVPCEVIVDKIEPIQITRLLIDKHVVGKNEWSAYDKSLLYYRLKYNEGYSVDQIADISHESKSKIRQRINAIEAYKDSKCTDTKKYSHFEQLVSNSKIKKLTKEDPQIGEVAIARILDGSIPDAQDVRCIPDVCKDEESKDRFLNGHENITDIVLDMQHQNKLQNKALINVVNDLDDKINKLSGKEIQYLKDNESDKLSIQRLIEDLINLSKMAEIDISQKSQ